jgi:hypothetical protein
VNVAPVVSQLRIARDCCHFDGFRDVSCRS